ncbi:MAG: FAD binding domain-containing protein [Planctomycetes bacterium]|nr:FAD binding domain-containing protein [Planctomycetota bacterium]
MRIKELEYHAPESLAQASVLLNSLGSDVRVIAGGTDVLADLKLGLITTGNLVSLASIDELKKIEMKKDGLWIGAMTTPNRIAASEIIQDAFTALADAGASMAGNQIRNLATLGGNICNAVPSADLPPSLLAAEAELLLATHNGERRLPVADFFLGPRKTAIRVGEILAAVFVPAMPKGTGTAYKKFQLRGASALAVVGAAARLTIKGGRIEKARIAIGAAAPTPMLCKEAGRSLEGKAPTDKNFEEAGRLAAKEVKPISDLRGSEEYRRDLTGVMTVRALKSALERADTNHG